MVPGGVGNRGSAGRGQLDWSRQLTRHSQANTIDQRRSKKRYNGTVRRSAQAGWSRFS